MLISATSDYYLTTFANRFNNQILQLCPQLCNVDIRLTDDSEVNIPSYLKDAYDKGLKVSDTPFCGRCDFEYFGARYNDIIRINEVASGLTEEEQYALLAHEVGHFIAYYASTGVSGQQEEIYADQKAMELGFHESLRSALIFCKVVIARLHDSIPVFMSPYKDQLAKDIKNIEDRIELIK